MACKACGSDNQGKFSAEIAIHRQAPGGRGKPLVWIFPELFVCLNCGKTEFVVPETQLRAIEESDAAGA